MSSFGGTGGGRTRMSMKVLLNVYDLSPYNEYLYPLGFGLHHSGIEINGIEYSFASGAGIFESIPKEAPGAKYRQTIEMGMYEGSTNELNNSINELRTGKFGPDDYNLLRRNCNHFANALCWLLLKRTIPGYVNRLADIGVCCDCLLPRQMIDHAPVGDATAKSGSGSTSSTPFLVKAPPGRKMTNQSSSSSLAGNKAFQGTGSKLGASLTTMNNSNSEERTGLLHRFGLGSTSSQINNNANQRQLDQDDIATRREKARKAALARLEQQQQQQQDSDKSQ